MTRAPQNGQGPPPERGQQNGQPSRTDADQGEIRSLRMKIGGMSCSFCTSTITRAYERIDGVQDVGVSLAHEEGLVKYDSTKVSEDQLKQILGDIGYTYRDPNKVASFEEEEAELARTRRRLYVAGSFTVASLALLMLVMVGVVATPAAPWIMLGLALVTMFGTGAFIKKMAYASFKRGIFNQHVLLEFAAFAGLVGGLLGLFVDSQYPANHFFAVSTFVTTYHILSDYASKVARTRSSQSIRKLLDLAPDTARVIRDGREREVPVDEVAVDELVRIRPGENVPVDGQVTEGASAVDQSLVTGEPIPEEKVAEDEVVGGSVNQTGTLVVRVARVGEESFLAQVARSIEEARAMRPGVLQLMDVILTYFVRGVLSLAVFAFALWTIGPMFWADGPNFFRAVFATLAVLVLGYPCALGMATPLAMIRGGGMAAERGILMRSGEAFQIMGQLRSIVLDKTGTVTRGEPRLADLIPAAPGRDELDAEAELLRLAAGAEASSEHLLARAIEEAAEARGIDIPDAEDFRAHAGRGVEARVDGAWVLVGKPAFLAEQGIEFGALENERLRLEGQGQTVVAAARDRSLLGLVGIADTLEDDATEAVDRMKRVGLPPVLITGDNERTANAVAAQVGIDEVLPQVLPEKKAAHVRELQQRGQRVAMVGDGINDAPALTQSDVGVAIGAGTDIAVESAEIVIAGNRLGAVVDAHQIGVNSYAKTKQNLTLAFAFNGIGVPAATTGFVHPIWAMVAMLASVTAVLTNSFAGRLVHRQGLPPPFPEAEQTRREEGAAAAPAAAEETAEYPLRLEVAGMRCPGCATNVNDNLPAVDGVTSVAADHERGVVHLTHIPAVVTEDEIRDHIRELGYEVTGHAIQQERQ